MQVNDKADWYYLAGSQALVRVAMAQNFQDRASGLNTAGFISGYRGSPVRNIDKELWRANRFLGDRALHFVPGINEDLVATACLGAQQSAMSGDSTHDGVYAMWYGKGPLLDRSIDAVAMTGGQPGDGELSPMTISRQMRAEGVETIIVVSDEPDKYPADASFAHGARFEHRRALARVQRELQEIAGVTVLIRGQARAAKGSGPSSVLNLPPGIGIMICCSPRPMPRVQPVPQVGLEAIAGAN